MMGANKKVFYFIMSLLAVVFVLAACGTSNENIESEENTSGKSSETTQTSETTNYALEVSENPIVTITMNNDEIIKIELEPKVAPNTVANFISLVEEGFYDGLIFHRVIPG